MHNRGVYLYPNPSIFNLNVMWKPSSDISIKDLVKDENLRLALLRALFKNKGIKSFACKDCGVPMNTIHRLIQVDEDFKLEVKAIEESVTDYVEYALYQKIEEGVVPAIIFYLDRKGGSRGYGKDDRDFSQEAQLSIVELPKRLTAN